MAEPARSEPDARPRGVVRPLSRAATRRCSRPGCPTPATATLAFRYDQQHASLVPLAADGGPETYDLCGDHADRTRPPHGWTLQDERPTEPDAPPPDASDLGSERTVAVLAAALRGVPADPVVDEVPAADDVVDTEALDAIVDQPFDEPDLFGEVDGSDPVADDAPGPHSPEALSELSALSGDAASSTDHAHTHDDDAHDGIVEQVPARTVPGAHRPA